MHESSTNFDFLYHKNHENHKKGENICAEEDSDVIAVNLSVLNVGQTGSGAGLRASGGESEARSS